MPRSTTHVPVQLPSLQTENKALIEAIACAHLYLTLGYNLWHKLTLIQLLPPSNPVLNSKPHKEHTEIERTRVATGIRRLR